MSSPPQKISLYNVNDLKNTTDDAIAPYLTSLPKPYKFKQNHSLLNTRLALGYTAVTIAGILFYADWKLGWDATKFYTGPACAAYFVLNGLLTYWIWGVESGTVFVGVREGGQKLTLKSYSKRHSPIYRLHIKYEAPSGQGWEDREILGNFTDWFNVHGYIDQKAFKRWLATNIEVVGLADPASKQVAEQKYNTLIDDVTAAAVMSGYEASTSSSSPLAATSTTTAIPSSTVNSTSKKTKRRA